MAYHNYKNDVSLNTWNQVVSSLESYKNDINVNDPETAPNSISCVAGGTEMLRVAKDGFYVRGERVPADDKEAETVYNAFKQFLIWAELNKQ
jgi:hypothetical protein